MKIRLDQLIVARGLAETRSKAQALLLAGSVRVNGQPAGKAGTLVDEGALVEVTAALPYASRGGHKLAHALDAFGLSPQGLAALDLQPRPGHLGRSSRWPGSRRPWKSKPPLLQIRSPRRRSPTTSSPSATARILRWPNSASPRQPRMAVTR